MDENFYKAISKSFMQKMVELWRETARKKTQIFDSPATSFDHGMASNFTDASGFNDSSEFSELKLSFSVPLEVIESGDRDKFLQKINEGIEFLTKQMVNLGIETIRDATSKVGNVINGKGEPVSVDLLCQIFERIEIKFDKNARPIIPTLFLNSNLEKTVRELIETPEAQLRLHSILVQKFFKRYSL